MNKEEKNQLKNEQPLNNINKKMFEFNSNRQANEGFNNNTNNYNETNNEENIYNMQNNKNISDNSNEGYDKESKTHEKQRRKILDKPLKTFGGICIVVAIVALIFSGNTSPAKSTSAQNALTNGVSTSVSAGTILSTKDENIESKDYNISHNSSEKETKIWVWDYAGEDGDYVQVLVGGSPIGDIFMIKHKPREFTVPATGEVQIKGIKDGGGGITYAVRYDINGTSYFNSAPEGEGNTYTLVKE